MVGFAKEVTRVSEEVGSQGILGGQANVPDVEGVWMQLTTNVNKVSPPPPHSLVIYFNPILFLQYPDVQESNNTSTVDRYCDYCSRTWGFRTESGD